MLQRNLFKGSLLLLMSAALVSCSVHRHTDRLEYAYAEGYHNRKLVIALPTGYATETHQKDDDGVLVRTFHYRDGSSFYIACLDKLNNSVIAVEKTTESAKQLTNSIGQEGSGQHADGTNWRRTRRDCFIIGYDSVQQARSAQFEQALQSLRVRRG